jgi:hypothetical protein
MVGVLCMFWVGLPRILGSILGRSKMFFFTLKRPGQFEAHSKSYTTCIEDAFPGVNAANP